MAPLEIALALHRCGIVSFPLGRETKKPLVKWEHLQWAAERPTEAEIRALFAPHPDCNVAMLAGETSRLWFVDADSAEAFEAMRRNWPDAPWVTRTRRGGHFRFRVPAEVEVRHLRNMVHIRIELPDGTFAEVDTRGQGGYVVAPGSVHPSGFVYQSEGWPWSPADLERVPTFDPAWAYTSERGLRRTFAEAIAEHEAWENRPAAASYEVTDADRRGGSALDCARRYILRVPGAVEGAGGDQHTYRVACVAVCDFSLSDNDAYAVLSEWNASCSPPWAERDLKAKIGNARKYANGREGSKLEFKPQQAQEPRQRVAEVAEGPSSPAPDEHEAAVLGAAMVDVDAAWLVNQHVTPDHFSAANGAVLRAIAALLTKNEPVEPRSVAERLRQTGELEAAGGAEYLDYLASRAAATNAVEFFARLVAGKHRLRMVGGVAAKIVREVRTGDGAPDEIADRCAAWFTKATEARVQDDAAYLGDGLRVEMDRVERNEKVFGLNTHLTALDRILGGLKAEEFYVIAARPSMGKSSLGFGIAREIAVRDNYGVGVFSLEMSRSQVCVNLLGQFTKVSPKRIADPQSLSPDERTLLRGRWSDLAAAPVVIDASNSLTTLQLRAKARRMKAMHNVALIVVDYLQLIHGEGETRAEQVASVAKGLKDIARELRIPVIALAQLNRGVESRDGHKPRLSDLKESGGIEEAADVVMLLWREGYYKRDKPDLAKKAELIVDKNRNGPTGVVPLTWEFECMRFSDAAF